MCSESDLKEVVSRLRDWFRVLHENGNHKRVKIQKPEKNSESSDNDTKKNVFALNPTNSSSPILHHFRLKIV